VYVSISSHGGIIPWDAGRGVITNRGLHRPEVASTAGLGRGSVDNIWVRAAAQTVFGLGPGSTDNFLVRVWFKLYQSNISGFGSKFFFRKGKVSHDS
jgi:hypothetical protein